jgi:hypothetical protein
MRWHVDPTHPLNICKEEPDSDIVNNVQAFLGQDTAALAFLMTYFPEQISPTKQSEINIGWLEELGIEQAILSIKKSTGIKKLLLMINTYGGLVTSSYKIAAAIRDNFEEITVFIPHIAASGGTLIALTGNKIVMGEMSNITPIDVQLPRDDEWYSVNSMIRVFDTLNGYFLKKSEDDATYPWKALADGLDPVEFQEWMDTSMLMQRHALEILSHRYSSFTKNAVDIVDKLNKEFPTHITCIRYNEASQLFHPNCFKYDSEDYNEKWTVFKTWFEKYLPEKSEYHIIRYILPKKEEATGESNVKTNI